MHNTNGAGVTERQEDWTPESVLEDWIADRKLTRRKTAFLKQFHQQQLHGAVGDMIGFLPIAPDHICAELGLSSGCTWWSVVAELLDHLESQKLGHKVTLYTWQLENCTLEKPPVQIAESKIINEENVLSDFISNKKISESRKSFLLDNHETRIGQMDYVLVHGNPWKGNICPDGIIEGLNDLAKSKEFPKQLDTRYPYWDYAIAFALDLINWIEKDELLESELSEKLDQINYQMNYFGAVFWPIYF